jgi:hypothetical protein
VSPGELWTNRSPRELAGTLGQMGFHASHNTVGMLLRDVLGLGHRQAAKDVSIGTTADRDAQFQRIAELRSHFQMWGLPIISIDTKKKELLGNFFRPGACHTNGQVHTYDHDFATAGDGKIIPYGVYDVTANEGMMTLAQGSDTGELVGDSIRIWWNQMGRYRYAGAGRILVLADSGGSNGCRVRLFHEQLWKLSHWLGIPIRVAHLPSYCSKYNPIDHRLFSHVSRSLRGVIFRSIETIRDAVAKTTTSTGLKVKVSVMKRIYQRGVQASEAFLMGNFILRDDYLPKYNYTTIHYT